MDSPRAARNSRGSWELDDDAVANADAEKTNNDNAIGAYISFSLSLSPFSDRIARTGFS